MLEVCLAELFDHVINYAENSYIEGKESNISKIKSCRICKYCFKVEQGSPIRNIGYENLFPPNRCLSKARVLLISCKHAAGLIKIEKTKKLLDHVCAHCTRQITSLHREYL